MISVGVMDCSVQMSIDSHTMTVIATDGNPIQPIEGIFFQVELFTFSDVKFNWEHSGFDYDDFRRAIRFCFDSKQIRCFLLDALQVRNGIEHNKDISSCYSKLHGCTNL